MTGGYTTGGLAVGQCQLAVTYLLSLSTPLNLFYIVKLNTEMCSALENKKFAWIITKFRTSQLNFPSLFFACIFFLKENSVQNCRKLAILYRADTSQLIEIHWILLSFFQHKLKKKYENR